MSVGSEGLKRSDYRDPLLVLIAREDRTCTGCAHVGCVLGVLYCSRHSGRYGRRCSDYREVVHGR